MVLGSGRAGLLCPVLTFPCHLQPVIHLCKVAEQTSLVKRQEFGPKCADFQLTLVAAHSCCLMPEDDVVHAQGLFSVTGRYTEDKTQLSASIAFSRLVRGKLDHSREPPEPSQAFL